MPHWTIDAKAIGKALSLERVALVNDYTPVAASVTVLDLERGDLAPLGDVLPAGSGARVVLGPGTGLGAGAIVPVEDRFAILATEAGHMEFGPADRRGSRALPPSGAGRWAGVGRGRAVRPGPVSSREGSARRIACVECPFSCPTTSSTRPGKGDALARAALDLFARWLGRFAGDLALTFEASGGVFIAGGIAPRMVDILQSGGFREAFDRKAPHDAWAASVPVYVIVNPEPALQGWRPWSTKPERFVFQSQGWLAA